MRNGGEDAARCREDFFAQFTALLLRTHVRVNRQWFLNLPALLKCRRIIKYVAHEKTSIRKPCNKRQETSENSRSRLSFHAGAAHRLWRPAKPCWKSEQRCDGRNANVRTYCCERQLCKPLAAREAGCTRQQLEQDNQEPGCNIQRLLVQTREKSISGRRCLRSQSGQVRLQCPALPRHKLQPR